MSERQGQGPVLWAMARNAPEARLAESCTQQQRPQRTRHNVFIYCVGSKHMYCKCRQKWVGPNVLERRENKAKLHCVLPAVLCNVYFSIFLDGLWTKIGLVKPFKKVQITLVPYNRHQDSYNLTNTMTSLSLLAGFISSHIFLYCHMSVGKQETQHRHTHIPYIEMSGVIMTCFVH